MDVKIIMLSEEVVQKPTNQPKNYGSTLYNSIYVILYRKQIIYSDESKSVDAWSRGRVGEGVITKGHKVTFGGDGYICHLHCGDGFKGVRTCQNLSNCILQIRVIYFISIIP